MFSPVKAMSAVALALAIAGAFGIALPFAQRGDAPGAEADGSAMAPSFFSGTMGEYPTWIAISSPVDARRDDGVVEVSGEGYTFPWNANDPRISGTAAIIFNETDYPGGATLARTGDIGKVRTGLIRIVNDDGSWEGPYTSLQIDNLGFESAAGWLTGTGAYEGLTAYVVLSGDLTFRGHVTAEGPPPAPESLPE
jgi:hypothetical protein